MKKTLLSLTWVAAVGFSHAQNHWNTVVSGTTKDLLSISFGNEQTGYISGRDGMLLKTIDSGATWQPVSYSGLALNAGRPDIVDIHFLSAETGYAVAGNYLNPVYEGKLYKSTDGGHTWVRLQNPFPVRICYFFSEDNGYLLGSAWFAGNTVTRMEDSISMSSQYFSYNPNSFLYGVDFRNELTGIVGGDEGYFHRTFDGGHTWDTVYSGRDSTVYSIRFINDTTIIAATGHGNRSVIISSDRGATWTDEVNSFTFAYPVMESITTCKQDSVIAVGHTTNNGLSESGYVYWLQDGAWQQQIFVPALHDVTTQSDSAAFAVGDKGLIITNRTPVPAAIPARDKEQNAVSIFPNPARGKINLRYERLSVQALRLIDISGSVLRTFPPGSRVLNIAGIAPGVYFLNIRAKERTLTMPVVVE